MSELLQKPNIEKTQGDRLSYTEVNALDNAIDSVIDHVNRELTYFCNVNLEFTGDTPDMTKEFSFYDAIKIIVESRRVSGLIITFLSKETKDWVKYQFIGAGPGSWFNTGNWKLVESVKEIDGGTF